MAAQYRSLACGILRDFPKGSLGSNFHHDSMAVQYYELASWYLDEQLSMCLSAKSEVTRSVPIGAHPG